MGNFGYSTLALISASFLAISPALGQQSPATFEVVIAGGKIMDPASGLDAVRNVGLTAGRIAAISKAPLKGKRIVDAKGKVVAPGFIDLHSHLHNDHLGGRIQAHDGVTTAWDGEAGQFPVDRAYANAAREGRAINYAFPVSWGPGARAIVMDGAKPEGTFASIEKSLAKTGWSTKLATPEQEKQILDLVESGLRQGGVGVAMLHGYAPGAGYREVYGLYELAAKYNVPVMTHVRGSGKVEEPDSVFQGFSEVIANSAATGAHVHVQHAHYSAGADYDRSMGLIADAQKRGVRVTTEGLSWGLGGSFVNAVYYDPKYQQEVLGKKDPKHLIYYGRPIQTWEELSQIRVKDPGAMIVSMTFDDENNPADQALAIKRLKFPNSTLATDGNSYYTPDGKEVSGDVWPLPANAFTNPRSTASYTRAIELFANKLKAVSLMDVIRMGSYLPAKILETEIPQMKTKGRIAVGTDADIIVFDPSRVKANATAEKPALLPTGMDYVFVNGVPLIDSGKLDLKVLPGKPIRNAAR